MTVYSTFKSDTIMAAWNVSSSSVDDRANKTEESTCPKQTMLSKDWTGFKLTQILPHTYVVMDRWSIAMESQLVWTVELMIKPKVKAYN